MPNCVQTPFTTRNYATVPEVGEIPIVDVEKREGFIAEEQQPAGCIVEEENREVFISEEEKHPPGCIAEEEKLHEASKSVEEEKHEDEEIHEEEEHLNRLVFFTESLCTLEELQRASSEILGKGSVGTSYKTILGDGTNLTVKRLRNVTMCKTDFEAHIYKFVGRLQHQNLVPL